MHVVRAIACLVPLIALVALAERPALAAPAPAPAPAPLRRAEALVSAVWADDASHVLVVGPEGRAFASDDAGATWTRQSMPTKAQLLAVWSDGRGLAIAAGAGGALVRRDGTGAWTAVASGTTLALRSLWGRGATIVAVGGELVSGRHTGVILWSTDRGATWHSTATRDTALHAVAGDGAGQLVAVGTQGGIYSASRPDRWVERVGPVIERTGTGTSTATAVSNPVALADLTTVAFDRGTWYALGRGGELVASPDAIRWTQRDRPFWTEALALARHRDRLIVVGPSEHAVQRGGGWHVRDLRGMGPVAAVAVTPGGTLYAVGHTSGFEANPHYFSGRGCTGCPAYLQSPPSGTIQRSRDGGATWTQLAR